MAAKELRDCLRDRRSLAAALIFSLFGPLVLALALGAVARAGDDDRPLRLALIGAEAAPSLRAWLQQAEVEVLPAPADPAAAVARGEVPLVLRLAGDYAADFRQAQSATLELIYDGADSHSRTALRRVESLLQGYGQRVSAQRLVVRGVSPGLLRPLDLQRRDLSTAASRAAVLLAILPMFLLMAAFIGGQNVAIDLTAGERERGSLEPLLHNPVAPALLALGKWGVSSVFAALGAVLTLVASVLVLQAPQLQALEVRFELGPGQLLGFFALLLPVALLAAGSQLLLATRAHSFKEAQTYLSLLLFVPILPGFAVQFGALEPAPWMRVVPLLGQQLAMDQVLRGAAPEAGALALCGALTVFVAALCAAATGRLLGHERIVFGR